ncbi:hypothetical protein FPZ24_08170 [Sphingomonas panacisoli]|uniref:Uncharacterized protein n=1 Tax=Sphingomonas panacisoli TaxID=1813879 RepID=A0A5B8LGN8_9SPHN|nr:hypothetical protein [Sphingomonas panacisoli]QDZ07458.1 hypothetical protein FPZ24_08170 [Sphingomonas panacisoli]
MSVLPLYGTPPKRDIIQRAYGYCGQASYEFELSPEEEVAALRAMNDQLAPFAGVCGYNMPQEGDGSAMDDSGINRTDVLGVSYFVAQLLAPTIGKQLMGSKPAIAAKDRFLAKYQSIPCMEFGRGTIRGSGNRRWAGWGSPFFPSGVDAAILPQFL